MLESGIVSGSLLSAFHLWLIRNCRFCPFATNHFAAQSSCKVWPCTFAAAIPIFPSSFLHQKLASPALGLLRIINISAAAIDIEPFFLYRLDLTLLLCGESDKRFDKSVMEGVRSHLYPASWKRIFLRFPLIGKRVRLLSVCLNSLPRSASVRIDKFEVGRVDHHCFLRHVLFLHQFELLEIAAEDDELVVAKLALL